MAKPRLFLQFLFLKSGFKPNTNPTAKLMPNFNLKKKKKLFGRNLCFFVNMYDIANVDFVTVVAN